MRRPIEGLQGGHASVAVTPLIIAVHQHGFQGSVATAMAATRIQRRVASALELHAEVVGRSLVDDFLVAWMDGWMAGNGINNYLFFQTCGGKEKEWL